MKILKTTILFVAFILLMSCKQEPKTSGGYTVVWEENFEDSTKLQTNWSKIPRGKSDWNNYMSNYDQLYDITNGNLILRGIKNTMLPDDPAPYLTGGIYTKDKRTFSNGRLEIRAKLFGARSALPALWLLPVDDKWPHGGEIDIMQRLNMDGYVYQTVHSDYTVNQKMKDNPKSAVVVYIKPDNYNVYAVELFTDSVKFFINDTHTFTYPRIETERSGQFPFGDREYYLLLDMQLGGKSVGAVNEQDLPAEMHIDWVRFLQKDK